MHILLWILAGVLAAIFLAVGLMTVLRPKEKLAAAGMGWVEGVNPVAVKALGALEVLAAVGLTLPALVDIAPILVPLAATGLIALMIGAAITHARQKETPMIMLNLVLLAMAAVVAWGRFGPHSF
ncbi:DoxX family protein [Streptomyces sp. NBC_00481]|uniref:DoxX family protein n=1 Tax=unclassified Streptomyces TaxID=2593676 RepID=UPI002DD7B748|nr:MULTISPECIES: DoxX family protein [unclassified Streptomyces]WRZ01149.1 DoxX family protein [Streptomyces sp. NBC_00481]